MMLRLVQGMLIMPAIIFLCLLILTACTTDPRATRDIRLPDGAVAYETTFYTGYVRYIFYQHEGKCFMVFNAKHKVSTQKIGCPS